MKKTTRLMLFGILIACCCAVIALLEVFDLHPQFSIGRYHSVWVGTRHMEFATEIMTMPVSGREKLVQKDYIIGPLKVAIEL